VQVVESLCDQSPDNAGARRAVLVGIFRFEDRLANDRIGGLREEAAAEVIESADARRAGFQAGESGKQRLGAKEFDPIGKAESLAREDHAKQGAKHLDRVARRSAPRLRMVGGLKLWAERFEIEQEQREDEVRVWLEPLFILLCRIEPRQVTARVFKIA